MIKTTKNIFGFIATASNFAILFLELQLTTALALPQSLAIINSSAVRKREIGVSQGLKKGLKRTELKKFNGRSRIQINDVSYLKLIKVNKNTFCSIFS